MSREKEKQGQQYHRSSAFYSSNLPKGLLYQILGGKTVRKRPNRATNHRDMAERLIHCVVREGVSKWMSYTLVREKLREWGREREINKQGI